MCRDTGPALALQGRGAPLLLQPRPKRNAKSGAALRPRHEDVSRAATRHSRDKTNRLWKMWVNNLAARANDVSAAVRQIEPLLRRSRVGGTMEGPQQLWA